jgi:hypothetical protein
MGGMATHRHCLAPSGNTSSTSLSSGPIWQLAEQIGTYWSPVKDGPWTGSAVTAYTLTVTVGPFAYGEL